MTFKEKMIRDGKIDDCPIIDMHTHFYKFYGAALPANTLEKSLPLFEDSNVKKFVCASHTSMHSPFMGNEPTLELAKQKPDLIKVLYSVNPNYPDNIEKDLKDGTLKIDYSAEDIHSFIEATLTDRIGEAGKKVHTGRSRNDQIALDERLYLKRFIPEVQNSLVTLIDALS